MTLHSITALRKNQTLALLALFTLCFVLIIPNGGAKQPLSAERLNTKLLRLHILADGDDTASQEIKYHVRDAVLALLEQRSLTYTDVHSFTLALSSILPDITETVNRRLAECGATYSCQVSLTDRFFPIKQYGTLFLPPGEYRALEIILGSGKGRNWWCMIFPSLCFTEGVTGTLPEEEHEKLSAVLTTEEYDLLFSQKKKPVFRLKIVKILRKLFSH